uniref:Uncharacterized protein n=1 Tax=Chromera velia CCMP2878 TaxID=1169474 RepID=A0A0G4HUW7_9ALVE|eukprot:Cvel_8751.t1-p1 / transcript=Cvel_8751.t1 / gene=Cvel_8751 / organism=Chromera_velia_CCMP2878 / gene_product=hypothetical protein / transcript_product=hypothetical protein / location=Cvel_scaffold489:52672-56542(+) / protein_length=1103 / sequence_SO=supercontig / SO=protein_coding / is_pseudo=false
MKEEASRSPVDSLLEDNLLEIIDFFPSSYAVANLGRLNRHWQYAVRGLKTVSVSRQDAPHVSIKSILKSLLNFRNLECLKLSGWGDALGDEELQALAKSLGEQLHELDLSGSAVTSLASLSFPVLHTFVLRQCDKLVVKEVPPEGELETPTALLAPNMRILDISRTLLNDKELFLLLQSLPSLQTLRAAYCKNLREPGSEFAVLCSPLGGPQRDGPLTFSSNRRDRQEQQGGGSGRLSPRAVEFFVPLNVGEEEEEEEEDTGGPAAVAAGASRSSNSLEGDMSPSSVTSLEINVVEGSALTPITAQLPGTDETPTRVPRRKGDREREGGRAVGGGPSTSSGGGRPGGPSFPSGLDRPPLRLLSVNLSNCSISDGAVSALCNTNRHLRELVVETCPLLNFPQVTSTSLRKLSFRGCRLGRLSLGAGVWLHELDLSGTAVRDQTVLEALRRTGRVLVSLLLRECFNLRELTWPLDSELGPLPSSGTASLSGMPPPLSLPDAVSALPPQGGTASGELGRPVSGRARLPSLVHLDVSRTIVPGDFVADALSACRATLSRLDASHVEVMDSLGLSARPRREQWRDVEEENHEGDGGGDGEGDGDGGAPASPVRFAFRSPRRVSRPGSRTPSPLSAARVSPSSLSSQGRPSGSTSPNPQARTSSASASAARSSSSRNAQGARDRRAEESRPMRQRPNETNPSFPPVSPVNRQTPTAAAAAVGASSHPSTPPRMSPVVGRSRPPSSPTSPQPLQSQPRAGPSGAVSLEVNTEWEEAPGPLLHTQGAERRERGESVSEASAPRTPARSPPAQTDEDPPPPPTVRGPSWRHGDTERDGDGEREETGGAGDGQQPSPPEGPPSRDSLPRWARRRPDEVWAPLPPAPAPNSSKPLFETVLRSVKLDNTAMGDSEVSALVKASPGLVHLSVRNCLFVGSPSIRAESLGFLDVTRSSFCASALEEAVAHCPSLRVLIARGCARLVDVNIRDNASLVFCSLALGSSLKTVRVQGLSALRTLELSKCMELEKVRVEEDCAGLQTVNLLGCVALEAKATRVAGAALSGEHTHGAEEEGEGGSDLPLVLPERVTIEETPLKPETLREFGLDVFDHLAEVR